MTSRMRWAVAASCCVAWLPFAAPVAAAQKVVAGKNTCTVTSLAPVLTKGSTSSTLQGSASVVCTLATALTIEISVVELDGSAEDTVVPVPLASKSLAVTANKAVVVPTLALKCVSTETGNEEYATKARISLAGVASAIDRTVPKLDAFAC